ncbi:MAG: sensor histidine kinase [Sciscionella sp.]
MDVLLAVAVAVFVNAASTGVGHWQHGAHALDPPGYAWLLGGVVALPWRRRAPVAVFLLTAVPVFAYYESAYPHGPSIVSPTIALATLAYCLGALRAGVAAGAVLLAWLGVDLARGSPLTAAGVTAGALLLWAVAAVSVGAALRARRASVVAARSEAAEAGRRRAEQERLGIAREVHDVVAHSLAMINVQAGTAAHVADRRPEQAKVALLEIKEASRKALNDLRATLAVLRADSGAEHAPAPGLDRLDELVATARAAGLAVRVDGDAGQLPAPVQAAAYRILQESLTNTVRHAVGATEVLVHIEQVDGALLLSVTDNGTGTLNGTAGSGSGLRGMRERADALGGSVSIGPRDGGGFGVLARLPIGGGTR